MNRFVKTAQLLVLLFGLSACGLVIVDPPVPNTNLTNPTNPNNPDPPEQPVVATVPANLNATGGEEVIDVTWNTGNASTTAGYVVVRSTNPITFVPVDGQTYTLAQTVALGQTVAYVGTSTAFTDQPLVGGQLYYYAVFANTSENNYSGSALDSATPFATTPVVPMNFNATAGEELINLTWDTGNALSTAGYLLVRSTSPITFVPVNGQTYTLAELVDTDQIVAYVGTSTSTTDQPLAPFILYYYALFAYTDDNNYSANLLDSATPLPVTPTMATNFVVTAGEKLIDLSWDTGNALTTDGFLVVRSTSPITFTPTNGDAYTLAEVVDTDQVVAYVGSATSFTDQPLIPMQIYYYALFAYTDDNYYSASLTDSDTPFNLWAQEAYIKPSNMDIADAFGFPLDIDGDVIVAGARGEDSNQTTVTNGSTASAINTLGFAGAAYVFRRTAGVWVQEAYLKAANAGLNDNFGVVSISGDVIVVSTNLEDSNQTTITNNNTASANNAASASGAAYVYRRNMGLWEEEAYLKAPNAAANDNYGAAVAISGDTIVVGAYDEDSNQTIITNGAGASGDNSAAGSGAAYVIRRTAGLWAQEAYLKAPNTGASDNFGCSVEIDGETIVVGAWLEDSNQTTITNGATATVDNSLSGSGAAYIFKRTGVNWAQEAYLKASNAGAGDNFGVAVAISGDTIVVGAYLEDSNQSGVTNGSTASADNSTADAGAAYVFKRTGVNWAQEAYLKAPNPGGTDYFGAYVCLLYTSPSPRD